MTAIRSGAGPSAPWRLERDEPSGREEIGLGLGGDVGRRDDGSEGDRCGRSNATVRPQGFPRSATRDRGAARRLPSVSVLVPVLDEARHIGACLDAIASQSYAGEVEVLVIDGGSTDGTRDLVTSRSGVRVVDNPERIQAAALNLGLAEAVNQVMVRVDGRCIIEHDYLDRCVAALQSTGATLVGGAMRPVGRTLVGRGVAHAMRSPMGAGPARFHTGGAAGWVDTVYLGAGWVAELRAMGGYREQPTNEDAELAHRAGAAGGVWFDPAIRSSYVPRSNFRAVAHQFFRYGEGRAETVRAHPGSLRLRQLAGPLLIVGLLSPARKRVGAMYIAAILAELGRGARSEPAAAPVAAAIMPVMHLSWGLGFLTRLIDRRRR